MKKRLDLILMLLICLFSVYSVSAFAADFPDVPSGHKNYSAISFLTSKGVIAGYEDGRFLPEREITRTEFCALMARTMGYSKDTYKPVRLPFSDVKEGYWGKAYISFCYEHGLINGMGDGTFAPANKVTFEQVVKMAVCAVGGQTKAQQSGGDKWYSGYLTVAEDCGLLDNADVNIGENALRGNVAQIVYNAVMTGDLLMYSGGTEDGNFTDTDSDEEDKNDDETAEKKSELEKAYESKDFSDVRVIVVDAGHNYEGKDTGARNDEQGIKEEILTWQIADKLRVRLESMGYKVIMTRENETSSIANTSTTDSLSARVELAHSVLADLFISIHCNTGGGAGAETYCFQNSGYSARLAKLVQKNIADETELYDRGVKTAGFYVLKNTLMPAVLIETGFIDNAKDAEFLVSEKGQDSLAKAIADAVQEYDKMAPIVKEQAAENDTGKTAE